ncbi:hypothetical protein LTR37_009468 [Vermiconidia calcicola]|uniref:Uncharacterized protein n=1 Tax=Vermiconidia calcicola TaxID=1690605 RepID=A0ACC3N7N8_9PEZI|nr:hypothetical protein LTR37_009468 [Vermiconidia calcicola]
MVNPFILLPLYIYPLPSAWNPLFTQARANPATTFYAIVNPHNGPGGDTCPGSDYVSALNTLNAIPNIKSLAYVHTANRWDCGSSGSDICACSAPIEEVKANVSTYAGWATAGCPGAKDMKVDGIFFDEAPQKGDCVNYMRDVTSHAKSALSSGSNMVLFNPGAGVDEAYWQIADYINVLENSGSAVQDIDMKSLTGNGKYASQATFILWGCTDTVKTLRRNVVAMLKDFAGGSLSDKSVYTVWIEHRERYRRF